MRVTVSNPASDLIQASGGRVYLWPKKSRRCGAVTTLATSNEPPRQREFVRVEAGEQFELYLNARLRRLPDQLHLDIWPTSASARPRYSSAYGGPARYPRFTPAPD